MRGRYWGVSLLSAIGTTVALRIGLETEQQPQTSNSSNCVDTHKTDLPQTDITHTLYTLIVL
jgi:hypothetical protein